MKTLPIIRERITKTSLIPKWVFLEHEARYDFVSKFVPGKIVIDCACGEGMETKVILEAGAKMIYAFDKSEDVIKKLKDANESKDLIFSLADASKLPLPNEVAEVYVSLETIEHLDDDTAFLSEVKRLLRPGGLFLCSTPNRRVTNPGKSIDDQPCNKFHTFEYSPDEFVSVLKKYFNEVELYGQNPNPDFKVRLLNSLGKILPFNFGTRIHQFYKLLIWLRWHDRNYYEVRKCEDGREYEYVLAVCKK